MADIIKKEAGRQGGLARKKSLSGERKAEIAKTAALRRWGAKATHKGNFKDEFGIEVDCYVLNDPKKTAVISQRGMGEVLGLGTSGSRLPNLVRSKQLQDYLGHEIRHKLENPVIFQLSSPGTKAQPPTPIHGYDVALLIDLCRAIVSAGAAGKLTRNPNLVKQANIIIAASAKSGIRDLVYALAGYSPSTEEVIQAFKAYVQEEAKKYEAEFPNELYMQWHRLYDIPVLERGRSWHFKYLTIRQIYYPLAKSNGKIYELLRALRANGGDQKKKLFQFLNEVGARALRMHIGRVLEMSEDSKTRAEYEARLVTRFGGQQELNLVVPDDPAPTAA